jgi:hypothetical protein
MKEEIMGTTTRAGKGWGMWETLKIVERPLQSSAPLSARLQGWGSHALQKYDAHSLDCHAGETNVQD